MAQFDGIDFDGTQLHGFYSQMAVDAGFRSSVYTLEDKSEVICSVVTSVKGGMGNWRDLKYVGKVYMYLRPHGVDLGINNIRRGCAMRYLRK